MNLIPGKIYISAKELNGSLYTNNNILENQKYCEICEEKYVMYLFSETTNHEYHIFLYEKKLIKMWFVSNISMEQCLIKL